MERIHTVRLILWGLVAVALVGAGALTALRLFPPGGPAQIAAGQPLGGSFQLVDHTGAPVTEAIFREKPTAVLFGFTHCPDVCPTALFEMSQWAEALGPDAESLRLVFVTVDPARDTPEAMRDYLSAFSGGIIGVTGEPAKVEAMLTDHHVYFNKVETEGGDYTMDHTASVFLLDRNGSLAGTIGRDETRETAVAKLQRLVAG